MKLTQSLVDTIQQLHRDGLTVGQISRATGVPYTTVRYHCGYREKAIQQSRSFRQKNPLSPKVDEYCRSSKEDRDFSLEDVEARFLEHPVCYLSGDPLDLSDPASWSFDHKIPKSRGGRSDFSNMAISCRKANMAKGDSTPEEFLELCKKVLNHHGYKVEKHPS